MRVGEAMQNWTLSLGGDLKWHPWCWRPLGGTWKSWKPSPHDPAVLLLGVFRGLNENLEKPSVQIYCIIVYVGGLGNSLGFCWWMR